jgi:hypothetical protein
LRGQRASIAIAKSDTPAHDAALAGEKPTDILGSRVGRKIATDLNWAIPESVNITRRKNALQKGRDDRIGARLEIFQTRNQVRIRKQCSIGCEVETATMDIR